MHPQTGTIVAGSGDGGKMSWLEEDHQSQAWTGEEFMQDYPPVCLLVLDGLGLECQMEMKS